MKINARSHQINENQYQIKEKMQNDFQMTIVTQLFCGGSDRGQNRSFAPLPSKKAAGRHCDISGAQAWNPSPDPKARSGVGR